MKLNQLFVAVVSTVAIASSITINPAVAKPCPFSSKLPTATLAVDGSPQSNVPTTNSSNLAGIALLAGLLTAGGVFWSRRFVQSDAGAVVNETENPVVLPPAPEQAKVERELVGSRK